MRTYNSEKYWRLVDGILWFQRLWYYCQNLSAFFLLNSRVQRNNLYIRFIWPEHSFKKGYHVTLLHVGDKLIKKKLSWHITCSSKIFTSFFILHILQILQCSLLVRIDSDEKSMLNSILNLTFSYILDIFIKYISLVFIFFKFYPKLIVTIFIYTYQIPVTNNKMSCFFGIQQLHFNAAFNHYFWMNETSFSTFDKKIH